MKRNVTLLMGFLISLALPTTAAGAPRSAAPVPEPRLFLSWNAPYGTPRAARSIDAACGDTSIVDTLYLSFDPGRGAPDFLGLSATLYFHAGEGAALAEFWKIRSASLAGSPIRVIFESDPDRGFITPWSAQGAGAPFYDFVSGSGRLRLIYAVAHGASSGVAKGKRYGFARVLIRRPAAGQEGCGAPMCVEWHASSFAYAAGEEAEVNRGDRWVAMNSPDGKVCEPLRDVVGAKPWRPGSAKPLAK